MRQLIIHSFIGSIWHLVLRWLDISIVKLAEFVSMQNNLVVWMGSSRILLFFLQGVWMACIWVIGKECNAWIFFVIVSLRWNCYLITSNFIHDDGWRRTKPFFMPIYIRGYIILWLALVIFLSNFVFTVSLAYLVMFHELLGDVLLYYFGLNMWIVPVNSRVFYFRSCIFSCFKTDPINYKMFCFWSLSSSFVTKMLMCQTADVATWQVRLMCSSRCLVARL